LHRDGVKSWPRFDYNGEMQRLLTVLWFATAFLVGAGLFLATRPTPVLNALVIDLQGDGLFERCRQAGACDKPIAPHPLPAVRPQTPPDMDRA
jgi:hypothetical protein